MDAQEIQKVLESGVVGHMSGEPLWRWLTNGRARLHDPAEALVELGVIGVRWEKPEAAETDTELSRAYLVLMLAESGTPHTPADWGEIYDTPGCQHH